MDLLAQVRLGLADPFAQSIALPPLVLTRAEARAVERALSATPRPLRFGAFRFEFHGIAIS